MNRTFTLEETYDKCLADGYITPLLKIDTNNIKSMLLRVDEDLNSAKEIKNYPNSRLKLLYDSLHSLTQAFLLFDQVKSQNHQCLFACLCLKHPELEFNWDFFEKVRSKRNGICYYGEPITQSDLKGMELQINLYINALKKAVDEKIKESE